MGGTEARYSYTLGFPSLPCHIPYIFPTLLSNSYNLAQTSSYYFATMFDNYDYHANLKKNYKTEVYRRIT